MLTRKKNFICLLLSLLIMYPLCVPVYGETHPPSINAESAILMDAKTGEVLYSKNANTRQYPASITKLMTALLAIENQKPTDIITFSKEAVFSIERGSSHIGLDVGEQITLDQALHGLLLESANEVANGIAELCDGSIASFAQHMTKRAKELGANNTNFANPHGLHNPNHYTTAYDMALIARAISKQPYFLEIMQHPKYQIPQTNKTSEIRYLSQQHRLMNEQRDGRMYRKDVIGGKTGYTDEARHTLVTIAKRGNVELICVILKDEKNYVYSDTNALLDYGFENYKSISLHKKGDVIRAIPMYAIKSGQLIHMANCSISVDQNIDLLVPESTKERKIDTIINLPDRINKGAAIGDIVGSVSYTYENQTLATHNLVISQLNYMSLPEPAVFPQKPQYTMPSLHMMNEYYITSIITILFIIMGGSLLISIKNSRRSKFRKDRKKLLRFSKTIK